MIFPEDKLRVMRKMLEAARDSCPSEGAAARSHWMAVMHMLQVVLDYKEEKPVIYCGEDGVCDESEAV